MYKETFNETNVHNDRNPAQLLDLEGQELLPLEGIFV